MQSRKIFLLSTFCLLLILTAYSKTSSVFLDTYHPILFDTIPDTIKTDDIILNKVEIEASFPGGENAWRNFLERNLNAATPVEYGAPAGVYTVIVQFVVDKDGKISDIKALTHQGYGMENEVIRLLRNAPKWSPAIQDGRYVKAYRKQPVTFMVTVDKKKSRRN